MEYINGLNEQQKKAVTYPLDKPLLVVAGAGTGKTKTLTARVAYLIREKNIIPSQILAVTFTNKASKEMWERIEETVGKQLLEGFKPIGKTFHSLGVQILREQYEKISVNKYEIHDGSRRRIRFNTCMDHFGSKFHSDIFFYLVE